MNSNCSLRLVSLLAGSQMVLCAQVARQPVVLKHWAAPLYWQPTPSLASSGERAVAMAAPNAGLPPNANALVFVAMPPCRVVDTRTSSQGSSGAFGPPSLLGGGSRTFPILSNTTCMIPTLAQAYSLNIIVVPPGPLVYVTAFPTGQSSPVAAIAVESPQGALASDTGIIPAGTDGSIDVYASNPTDIVIDINGYYAAIGDSRYGNLALGAGALASNTPFTLPIGGSGGVNNTAVGNAALQSNTTGLNNTATGTNALHNNITGRGNTASGVFALETNTAGGYNTATGYSTLASNIGSSNTATGAYALSHNTTGNYNTAYGGGVTPSSGVSSGALWNNTTGSNNIAIGFGAASNVSGDNSSNIHIGSQGSANDDATIRIGGIAALGDSVAQRRFFASGIRGITTGNNDAIPVVIDSNGQLGTISSSIRLKEDVHDMDTASADLMRLRPVTFRYQQPFADGSKPIQYGLIAEEVAEVYPGLVALSADGQIETVKYQLLDSMLLNELQKEHRQVRQQAETIRQLEARLAVLEKALVSGR